MPGSDVAVLRADMQAVIVIHGMGEQIPMDTIKGFVNAVWQNDDVVTANGLPNPTEVWNKPDARIGSAGTTSDHDPREQCKPAHSFLTGVRDRLLRTLLGGTLTAGASWDWLTSMGTRLAPPAAPSRSAPASGSRGCYCGFSV